MKNGSENPTSAPLPRNEALVEALENMPRRGGFHSIDERPDLLAARPDLWFLKTGTRGALTYLIDNDYMVISKGYHEINAQDGVLMGTLGALTSPVEICDPFDVSTSTRERGIDEL